MHKLVTLQSFGQKSSDSPEFVQIMSKAQAPAGILQEAWILTLKGMVAPTPSTFLLEGNDPANDQKEGLS